ncbi:hypothetical protein PRUB_b0362 [Pseudoalteromonas rubra]|uniref:Uncharacterized protein n=1 Tax=Pseudoalteromonas rubra TaxID=43658 RepID=A0A8T0C0M9_9GAMM|nr:hypothetical protein PRUB_b0362 [Pseudoalteromonas rubra]
MVRSPESASIACFVDLLSLQITKTGFRLPAYSVQSHLSVA